MNNTEINTLLASGVHPKTLTLAIASGKIQAAIETARRVVDHADGEKDSSHWKEMFRYMEKIEQDIPTRGRAVKSKPVRSYDK